MAVDDALPNKPGAGAGAASGSPRAAAGGDYASGGAPSRRLPKPKPSAVELWSPVAPVRASSAAAPSPALSSSSPRDRSGTPSGLDVLKRVSAVIEGSVELRSQTAAAGQGTLLADRPAQAPRRRRGHDHDTDFGSTSQRSGSTARSRSTGRSRRRGGPRAGPRSGTRDLGRPLFGRPSALDHRDLRHRPRPGDDSQGDSALSEDLYQLPSELSDVDGDGSLLLDNAGDTDGMESGSAASGRWHRRNRPSRALERQTQRFNDQLHTNVVSLAQELQESRGREKAESFKVLSIMEWARSLLDSGEVRLPARPRPSRISERGADEEEEEEEEEEDGDDGEEEEEEEEYSRGRRRGGVDEDRFSSRSTSTMERGSRRRGGWRSTPAPSEGDRARSVTTIVPEASLDAEAQAKRALIMEIKRLEHLAKTAASVRGSASVQASEAAVPPPPPPPKFPSM